MSNTIWVLQKEPIYDCNMVFTECFWFEKPTLSQLMQRNISEKKAEVFLEKGKYEGAINNYYLREFKEGEDFE